MYTEIGCSSSLALSSCQWPDWSHGNIHTAPRNDPEEEQVGGHLGQRSIQRAVTSGSPKCSDGRIYYTSPLPTIQAKVD